VHHHKDAYTKDEENAERLTAGFDSRLSWRSVHIRLSRDIIVSTSAPTTAVVVNQSARKMFFFKDRNGQIYDSSVQKVDLRFLFDSPHFLLSVQTVPTTNSSTPQGPRSRLRVGVFTTLGHTRNPRPTLLFRSPSVCGREGRWWGLSQAAAGSLGQTSPLCRASPSPTFSSRVQVSG